MPLTHRSLSPIPPYELDSPPTYSAPLPPLSPRFQPTHSKFAFSRALGFPRQPNVIRLLRSGLVLVVVAVVLLISLQFLNPGSVELWKISLAETRVAPQSAKLFPAGSESVSNPLAILEVDRDGAYALYGLSSPDEISSPPSSPPIKKPVKRPDAMAEHTFLPNGLLEVNPRGRHPMYDLMERAEREWEEKKARQSKTLEQAVKEYRRRWGRWPPKGFDRWWSYVQRHHVQLPDEYDQIMHDLSPFFAYSPTGARELQQAAKQSGTYTLRANTTTMKIEVADDEGVRESPLAERMRGMLALLRGVGEYDEERHRGWKPSVWGTDEERGEEDVEDDVERLLVESTGEWEATFSAEDNPSDFWDWEMAKSMHESILEEEYLSPDWRPEPLDIGWSSSCPPSSPLRSSALPPPLPPLPLPSPATKTFIYSHSLAMSPCLHPELVHTAGYFSEKRPAANKDKKLVFTMCKTVTNGDVLSVPVERWYDESDEAGGVWEEKDERMVWRGSTTGIFYTDQTSWRHSQRARLVSYLNPSPLHSNLSHAVLPPYPRNAPIGKPYNLSAIFLGPVLTDVGFVGQPIQCEDAVCEELDRMWEWRGRMTMDRMRGYKYMLDIDGNGWSARFKQLMNSNSVVLKATVFPEWYLDRIQPWYHYVPIQYDLSDLYDILTFFRGDPSRGGLGSHDELAKAIGERGGRWSREFWRWEDMVACVWRMMLEYARVVGEGRGEREFCIDGLE